MGFLSPQLEVFSLQIVSRPKVLSVQASSVALATSSAVLTRTASPSDSVKPSLSGAARMGSTNADTASPFRESTQYLRDLLAQRDAAFSKLDDRNFFSVSNLSIPLRFARRTLNLSLPPIVQTVTFCKLLLMIC